MELLLVKSLAALALPPGLFVVLLGAALLLRPGTAPGLLIATCGATLLLLSAPPVAERLMRTLDRYDQPAAQEVARAGAIVILAGDRRRHLAPHGRDTVGAYTLERVRHGALLARTSGLPVLVSGGVVQGGGTPSGVLMARALAEFGVQARWVETTSRTTWENAVHAVPLLRRDGVHRILLVSHYWHLPRAVPAFAAQGIGVVPIPAYAPLDGSGRDAAAGGRTLLRWLPRADALAQSAAALHEHLGLIWYRLRYDLPVTPFPASVRADNA